MGHRHAGVGRRGRRTIPLPSQAIAGLPTHRARQREECLCAGRAWRDWGLVFTASIGTPLDAANVGHYFHRLCPQAGLAQIRFHDLRHTCASLLLAQGVPPRVVLEILGHSHIGITMDTYSHVFPAMQRKAADRKEAILATRRARLRQTNAPEQALRGILSAGLSSRAMQSPCPATAAGARIA